MHELFLSRITAERTESGVFVIDGTDIIVFTYANPSDSGVYNCTATNKLGTAWRAYRVTVNEEGKRQHLHTDTRTHTYAHTHIHIYRHTHTHTHTTRTHTYIHTNWIQRNHTTTIRYMIKINENNVIYNISFYR